MTLRLTLRLTHRQLRATPKISGTIKVLHHRTDRDQDGTMAKLTEGFNALYPNVTVEYQSFTNYADDIATMMQSDNYGDVLMTPQALKQADLPQLLRFLRFLR